MKKLLPSTLAMIILVLMILLHFTWPIQNILPPFLRWFGFLPLLFGLRMSSSASNQFALEKTNINTFDEPGKLVTNGWFRYSRNPMYLGGALVIIGVWILPGSLSPTFGIAAFILIIDRRYIAHEERAMAAKFGQDYENYKRHVRKWF